MIAIKILLVSLPWKWIAVVNVVCTGWPIESVTTEAGKGIAAVDARGSVLTGARITTAVSGWQQHTAN